MSTQVQTHVPSAKIYKEAVAKETEKTASLRNQKQVQNIKDKVKQEGPFSRDSLLNTHQYAYNNTRTIHYIATFPDLIIIIGQEEMLRVFQDVLRIPLRYQLLSYDTTFNLGEFYVSQLLFRNTAYE